jgi:hypothetical protein
MSVRKTRQKDADRASPTIPKLEVNKFLQQVEERAWTDAEKELDNIRQKSDSGQWSRGYVKALEGLLLTFRGNDDKYIYLPKIVGISAPEVVAELKSEFAQFSVSDIHGDYDRGFFKALEDYLSLVPTSKQSTLPQSTQRPLDQGPESQPITPQRDEE